MSKEIAVTLEGGLGFSRDDRKPSDVISEPLIVNLTRRVLWTPVGAKNLIRDDATEACRDIGRDKSRRAGGLRRGAMLVTGAPTLVRLFQETAHAFESGRLVVGPVVLLAPRRAIVGQGT